MPHFLVAKRNGKRRICKLHWNLCFSSDTNLLNPRSKSETLLPRYVVNDQTPFDVIDCLSITNTMLSINQLRSNIVNATKNNMNSWDAPVWGSLGIKNALFICIILDWYPASAPIQWWWFSGHTAAWLLSNLIKLVIPCDVHAAADHNSVTGYPIQLFLSTTHSFDVFLHFPMEWLLLSTSFLIVFRVPIQVLPCNMVWRFLQRVPYPPLLSFPNCLSIWNLVYCPPQLIMTNGVWSMDLEYVA